VLEIVSHFNKSLKELRNELFAKFGEVYIKRIDFSFRPELQSKAMGVLRDYIYKIKNHSV
jgi:hypothetical protein